MAPTLYVLIIIGAFLLLSLNHLLWLALWLLVGKRIDDHGDQVHLPQATRPVDGPRLRRPRADRYEPVTE